MYEKKCLEKSSLCVLTARDAPGRVGMHIHHSQRTKRCSSRPGIKGLVVVLVLTTRGEVGLLS